MLCDVLVNLNFKNCSVCSPVFQIYKCFSLVCKGFLCWFFFFFCIYGNLSKPENVNKCKTPIWNKYKETKCKEMRTTGFMYLNSFTAVGPEGFFPPPMIPTTKCSIKVAVDSRENWWRQTLCVTVRSYQCYHSPSRNRRLGIRWQKQTWICFVDTYRHHFHDDHLQEKKHDNIIYFILIFITDKFDSRQMTSTYKGSISN